MYKTIKHSNNQSADFTQQVQKEPQISMETKLKKIALITMLISLFIFSSLMIFDSKIGGNATNGKIENGVYYVKNNEGVFKEVKKHIYYIDYIFTCFTIPFIFSGIISISYLFVKCIGKPIEERSYEDIYKNLKWA